MAELTRAEGKGPKTKEDWGRNSKWIRKKTSRWKALNQRKEEGKGDSRKHWCGKKVNCQVLTDTPSISLSHHQWRDWGCAVAWVFSYFFSISSSLFWNNLFVISISWEIGMDRTPSVFLKLLFYVRTCLRYKCQIDNNLGARGFWIYGCIESVGFTKSHKIQKVARSLSELFCPVLTCLLASGLPF